LNNPDQQSYLLVPLVLLFEIQRCFSRYFKSIFGYP